MPGAVRHEAHKLAVAMARPRSKLIKQGADFVHDLQIRPLVVSAHVVGFARRAPMEDLINRTAMIPHPKPIANVLPGAVHGDRFVRQTFSNHDRDELLSVLPGAVVVGAVRDRRVHAVGVHVSAHKHVGRGLGRGVGTVGRIGRRFREEPFGPEAPENFIRRNMVKA